MAGDDLHGLRQQIDEVDEQLVVLLNKRAAIARQIGIAKQGQEIYHPEREAAVLAHVNNFNQGPLPRAAIELIMHVIMASCRDLQLQDRAH